jgi:hypothetical protein
MVFDASLRQSRQSASPLPAPEGAVIGLTIPHPEAFNHS